MNNLDNVRFWLAAAVSPALPIALLVAGSVRGSWPLISFFGYLYAFLIAFPIMAAVVPKRSLVSCLAAGGIAAVLPFFIIGLIALVMGNGLTGAMLVTLSELFAIGASGGALFWMIAFWGAPAPAAPKA